MIFFQALLVASASAFVTPHITARPPIVRHAAPLLAAGDIEPLQELPTPALLKAIAKCGSSATAADVAAAAGLEISEARRQLLVLARLVGAELQVSADGELLFVFDQPGALRRSLRALRIDLNANASKDVIYINIK